MADEQVVDQGEDFTAAFARMSDIFEGKEPEKPAEPEKAAEPETPTDDEKTAEPEAPAEGEKPAEPETPAEGEKPAESEKPAEPEKVDDDELLSRLASLVSKAPKPEEKPAPAREEPPAQSVYSPEEEELLSSYEKDWPDVAKAEQIRRRGEYKQLIQYVFSEVAKEFKPLAELTQALAARTAYGDIKSKVEDYDDVRDGVVVWVETQPEYLRNAYKHVIQSGTPDEVADLVGRYKREAGVAPKAPAPRKPEPELPDATKKAAASLAPVGSKRSAVPQADDPSNFDGAFAAFDKIL